MAALRRRGYDVREWHQTQDVEKFVPADWLFFDRTRLKVFGLHYKALYRNGSEHWPLDAVQHSNLARYPWIVYCASELTGVPDHGRSLSVARFYGTDFPYQARLRRRARSTKYLRWQELRSLSVDVQGTGPAREASQTSEYMFLNLERKRALRLRSAR